MNTKYKIPNTKYRIFLFSIFCLVVILIASNIAFNATPLAISRYLLAQIGVSVSVETNPFNTLAQQLQEKEKALSTKEVDLALREKLLEETRNRDQETKDKILTYLFIIAGVLLILILLNFYLDYRRKNSI